MSFWRVDGPGYQVQRIDELGKIPDDIEAERLAREAGLKLDGLGFVLDVDGRREGCA